MLRKNWGKRTQIALVAVTATMLLAAPAHAQIPAKAEVDAALTAAYDKYKTLKEGANADYIPALAKVPSNLSASPSSPWMAT